MTDDDMTPLQRKMHEAMRSAWSESLQEFMREKQEAPRLRAERWRGVASRPSSDGCSHTRTVDGVCTWCGSWVR